MANSAVSWYKAAMIKNSTSTNKTNPLRLNNPVFLSVFFFLWALALYWVPDSLDMFSDYASFALLGVSGAIFANSTGAGGGVVFIPMFNQLGFSEAQALATSFGIQCFGMTAGAYTWIFHYRNGQKELHLWQSFLPLIVLASLFSIAGLWTVYGLGFKAPASLHLSFSVFSVVLGLCILITVYRYQRGRERSRLSYLDLVAIALIAYFGGGITAWLSVGVGELLAIYLILRRFDVTLAVAVAVVVSALTVWAAAPQHFLIDPQAYWQVLLFGGPGAVIGGIFAKTLVSYLSARKLKIFFAFWLLVIGFSGLPVISQLLL